MPTKMTSRPQQPTPARRRSLRRTPTPPPKTGVAKLAAAAAPVAGKIAASAGRSSSKAPASSSSSSKAKIAAPAIALVAAGAGAVLGGRELKRRRESSENGAQGAGGAQPWSAPETAPAGADLGVHGTSATVASEGGFGASLDDSGEQGPTPLA